MVVVLLVLVTGLLLLVAPPVAAAGARHRVAPAAGPPFKQPASWSTICDARRGSGTPLRAGVNCRWIQVDGVARRYVVVVPRAIARHPNAGWPLVLMLHGVASNGEDMMARTDWIKVGAREGIITVFPTSWRYHFLGGTTVTRWNTYAAEDEVDRSVRLDGYPENKPYPARDTEFLRRVVRDVSRQLRVDPRRIHVSGSSNGGNLISRVAVDLGDLVASVSCSGFCAPAPASARDGITRAVPMLFNLGTDDPNVLRVLALTQEPDPQVIPLDWPDARPVTWELLADLIDMWRLDDGPTSVVATATTTSVTWATPRAKGMQGAEVRLLLLLHAQHRYPMTTNNPERFSMAAIAWRFFASHRMP